MAQRMVKSKQEFRKENFSTMKQQVSVTEQIDDKRRILALSFEQLRDELKTGKIKAVDALEAYQYKALEVNEQFNCVTEFVREAREWAAELDSLSEKEKAKMPLFGVPFSVKDNFAMKGYDMSLGLAKNLGEPAEKDCLLVTHLRNLGAIPLARTNVPQTLLSIACSNPVWGTTLNPHDKTRSPGGSSGGEACLVAAGGVPFGIGSDLAGSLRIPAHFCGVTTIKPTSARLKCEGAHPGIPGCTMLGLAYGFFAKDVSTVNTLMGYTVSPDYFKLSPYTSPMPWNSDFSVPEERKPRIGYYAHDGWFNATPACVRAVELAKDHLESLGYDLYPFKVPRPFDAYRIGARCLLPDDGEYLLQNQYKYEKIDPYLLRSYRALKVPLRIRHFLAFLIHRKYRRLANVMNAYNGSMVRMREAQAQALEYRQEFLDAMRDQKLDAIICPVLPFAAIPPDYASKLFPACLSTLLYNLIDFPAGCLPITMAQLGEGAPDGDMSEYPEEDMMDRDVRRVTGEGEKTTLPVGVQVVTLPYREELCMHLMGLLEKAKDY